PRVRIPPSPPTFERPLIGERGSMRSTRDSPRRSGAARRVVLASSLLLATACVERLVRVESDPPNAAIYLNGRYVGETPLEQPFEHYGTIRIDAWYGSRPGITQYFELETPWYERVPFDLFAELLDPRTHLDRQVCRVVLPPAAPFSAEDAELL